MVEVPTPNAIEAATEGQPEIVLGDADANPATVEAVLNVALPLDAKLIEKAI